MHRLDKRLKPHLLLLSEGDLWLNMLHSAKKRGARIALVSGKLSERSAKRYAKVPFFTRSLFDNLDLICAQNTLYADRLKLFSKNVVTTGNLKFDIPISPLSASQKAQWQKQLHLQPHEPLLVIGSTHPGEEELLIPIALETDSKILLIPRHPERFDRVFAMLPHGAGRLSKGLTGQEKIILIDTMGLLTTCYQLATLAIVGGSFVPGIGGHNILEPIQASIPVLFGPYMKKQQQLAQLVCNAGAGKQLAPHELSSTLQSLLNNPALYQTLQTKAIELASHSRGATERTWNALFP
jgi:3-deoxy-D-manno-octulosonic-acid transferase